MKIPENLLSMIKDKSVVLLLGAGASVGASHSEGAKIAQGKDLARLIAEKFLDESFFDKSLAYIADLVIDDPGLFPLQDFLHDYFIKFHPAAHHLLIANIPWRAIFTLNFDLIIERAYTSCADSIQELAIFKSDSDKFEDKIRSISHLPFYKLHGCITSSNDYNNPFILSNEQYITHYKNRVTLFHSLQEYAMSNPIVYVGTSLQDSDVRSIMLRIEEKAAKQQYRSYIITPYTNDREINFWSSRKISVLQGTFKDFLESVSNGIDKKKILLSLHKDNSGLHDLYQYFVHGHTSKSLIIDKFLENAVTHINDKLTTEKADPKRFYKGEGQGFSPMIDEIDLKRNLSDKVLLNNIIDDTNRPKQEFIIIKGHAGSGKTVILRRIAYDAGIKFNKLSFWVENSHPIDNDMISEIYSRSKQRIYLFIDDSSKNVRAIQRILRFATSQGILITIISTDRINIWNDVSKDLEEHLTEEYILYNLNEKEVNSLINLLTLHNSLGFLTDKPRSEQIEAFTSTYERQLLVALHEATLGKTFPEIVHDEYKTIIPEEAQLLYKTICTMHRFGVNVRAGLIARLHGITFDSFKEKFFGPLEGIVISKFDPILQDYVYGARHRHVAELVFERIFSTNEERYVEFMRILQNLNTEYRSDYEVLTRLVDAQHLENYVYDPNLIRILYSTIIAIYPQNPFLYQQYAIFEMKHPEGSLIKAKEYLNKATQLAPQNHQIIHTVATFERRLGQNAQSSLERVAHRRRAKEISQSLFNSQKQHAYPYVTYLFTSLDELRESLQQETPHEIISKIMDDIQKVLQSALQLFPADSVIHKFEHDFFKLIGESEKSIDSLKKSFNNNKADIYNAISLTKYYISIGDTEMSLSTINAAIQQNPYNKDLHFLCARILMGADHQINDTIKRHLKYAFNLNDNRYEAQFWYARLLYIQHNDDEAYAIFDFLNQARIEPRLKMKPRGCIQNDGEPVQFSGTIYSLSHSYLFISPDSGKRPIFAHAKNSQLDDFSLFKCQQRVKYSLAFNFRGATATDLLTE